MRITKAHAGNNVPKCGSMPHLTVHPTFRDSSGGNIPPRLRRSRPAQAPTPWLERRPPDCHSACGGVAVPSAPAREGTGRECARSTPDSPGSEKDRGSASVGSSPACRGPARDLVDPRTGGAEKDRAVPHDRSVRRYGDRRFHPTLHRPEPNDPRYSRPRVRLPTTDLRPRRQ